MATRKRHTKEFKLEAVRLLTQSGRPGADVARELGIRRNCDKADPGASPSGAAGHD